jgi:transcriptional regulator with XRE-family HTH domain
MSGLLRKSHFLGAKVRGLRKRNGLTLQDVSARCIQLDAALAPSVSYLSMIETGQRIPSEELLGLLAAVFQKSTRWFLDENPEVEVPPRASRAGAARIPLEPGFLFSRELLEAAIPELLAQTGTTGRQFAHLLIRSYQEMSRNEFPDLERSAEQVGERRFPLGVEDLLRLCRRHGLEIHWFDRKPVIARDNEREVKSVVRSFFESPSTVYVNRELQEDPARLKFDLASHLAHKVLHGGDGLKSPHATGGEMGGSPDDGRRSPGGMDAQDVLFAWRDFECSFFAGALLAPKHPFRRFLTRESYRVEAGRRLELTPSVIMRRMTVVSPYRHWHFFDAYPPGFLRAVYRGNGIPLPWGNMAMVSDPCPRWAVFRMLHQHRGTQPASQISVLQDGERALLYCCHSMRTRDMAGNPHVLSVGVDLLPALESQGLDAEGVVAQVADACRRRHGHAPVPAAAGRALRAVGKVLNIAWIADALEPEASVICPRSTACPRTPTCEVIKPTSRAAGISEVRQEILETESKGDSAGDREQ